MSGLLVPVAWIMDLTTKISTALKLTFFGVGSATFMGLQMFGYLAQFHDRAEILSTHVQT